MTNIRIDYNPVLEFFCSIERVVFDKEIHNKGSFDSFEFDKEVEKYVNETNENMSSFMKSEMTYLIRKTAGGIIVPIYFCLTYNITDLNIFFDKFHSLSGEDYFKMYAEAFEITGIIENEPSIIKRNLKEILKWGYSIEESRYFEDFKLHPDEMKYRLESLFRLYYEKFYKYVENIPAMYMQDKISRYEQQLKKGGIEFLSNLLAVNEGFFNSADKPIVVYPSYFYEIGMTQHDTKNFIGIIFGDLLEQRINGASEEKMAKEILKILADEKRYEILGLLGRKKYCSVELAKEVKLTKATVSYHVNKMMSLGLLNIQFGQGNRTYMSLNRSTLKKTLDFIYKDLSGDKDE